ncbi:class I SAM-dependent methyltransferase [Bryobacter aggregatus]|uniref:class I SAM-dependent methyltransferase n=1 Tax=Bryobacter aggregatus TaxID=360054 RepID=UPI00068F06A7|nr:class I SAM-dependent methyltransferase [Bryobacter aggregatus]
MFSWFQELLKRGQTAKSAPVVDLAEIRRSFEDAASDEEHFPSTIDPRIYHVQLIARYFGDLNGKRVLDAGCGKGRFGRVLHEQNPQAKIVSLDLALAMLRHAGPPLLPCCGTLTQYPFRDASFDCVYATESLEHAVDIESAIAELCRVLKPGGKLVIIDKNADHWGRFDTPHWERWFRPAELEQLLRRHCKEASSEFISYWEDVPPDGLFVAWKAIR